MRHTVSFIGAGVSKGVERKQPIPLMMDFVPTMCHYARSDDIVFMALIALEAMDAYAHKDPELRKMALDRNPKRHKRELLQRIESRPPESIEDLLVRVEEAERLLRPLSREHLAAAIHSPSTRVRYAINRMFLRIGWGVNAASLIAYLRHRCCDPTSHETLIPFNYDLITEHALEEATDRWCATAGYGFNARWAAIEDPEELPGPPLQPLRRRRLQNIEVLKPHGSLNWLMPDDGRFQLPFISMTDTGRVRYIGTRATHAYVTFTDHLPIPVSPLIVPPTANKPTHIPLLKRIREQEEAAIEAATEVSILGWSLPDTDSDQIDLIQRAVARRKRAFDRFVVVNFGASTAFFDRLAAIFAVPRSRVEVFNDGIQQFLLQETSLRR